MKILVVGSPHSASTRDVWMGAMKGLAQNGAGLQSYDMLPRGEFFSTLVDFVREKHLPIPMLANVPSPMVLAYEPVFMAAHWHEVDVVFFISPQYVPLELPRMLRKDGFKTWAYMTECPYEDPIDAPQKADCFDFVFLNDRNSESYWQSFNPHSFYIPHSYDPDKHFPSWDRPQDRPVGIGIERKPRGFTSWTPPDNGHDHVVYVGSGFGRRQKYLEDCDWSGINLKVYGHWPLLTPPTSDRDKEQFAPMLGVQTFEGFKTWEDLPPTYESPIKKYVIPKMVDNTFTARLYRGSAIGINMHRLERWANNAEQMIDDGEAYSMGPRGVELAACGTFQVSDFRQEIVDVFGDSVPIHRNPEEMGVLIRKFLDDPVRRQELAVQQHEAIKDRTFANHMRRVLEIAA